ncbi:MAG TPA: DedA family protein [Persephonella sp.]|uniref:Snare associated golgi protein n=1 Tax=Persephonella marina (strain DSM 14350 / EX-H1) TaxID=123214 RepID=C0QTF8_PERMH|nr:MULTISPECIES: YqaA family protein [Persephonella]ACO04923.1 snare associated golgi protein [Persephonella marina EX-H1]HCB70408.1 DedA family protein [Persephonella sp.]
MFEGLREWAEAVVNDYGYLGIFLISFTESIIQPVPPDPFITGGTAFGLSPVYAALIAAVASVLGGMVGYALGKFLGEPVFKKFIGEKYYDKGEILFRKYGIWAVIIAAITPIPFKAICWLAGIFEMPFWGFVLAAFIGRLPRFLFMAFFGQWLGSL